MTTVATGHRPPSDFLALTEAPRALFEFASFIALRPAMAFLPRGDGHPVLVLPGFLASDASTIPLRNLLVDLGYDAVGWELGRNVQITNARVNAMGECLNALHQRTGRKVSIVGWSLGGLLARELAKLHPEAVRQVISLGSPLTGDRGISKVGRIFEALNGPVPEVQRRGRFTDLEAPPPVPSTSVFTKSDGVVHWRGSIQPEGPERENVEVLASHIGLGVNPSVMWLIANRLAQPEGEWAPFEAKGCAAWAFPGKPVVH
ncbi:MAG: alpha/beta hydrolase [Novosphingobium sp.]|nr:alpha/beta hydrolase [Novosphingobium sp.]